ncbi:hypothetical protein ACHFJ0_06305 [Paracoccus sp. NGMCC 1.201697]|uniref:DUF1127 domain-containing protein n=1 Tax=Paracoccus broussonetiae subsp. drimophilus TaxID=3373869 RepID=A0ABW7LJ70_9RHOB
MFASDFTRQPRGLADRLLMLLGFRKAGDPCLRNVVTDRYAALDDPVTRKALADLPPHLLRDVGVSVDTPDRSQPVEGEALRKYLW